MTRSRASHGRGWSGPISAFLVVGALVAAGRAMDVEGLVIAAVLILAVVVLAFYVVCGPKRAANRLAHPMAVGVAWFRGRTDVPVGRACGERTASLSPGRSARRSSNRAGVVALRAGNRSGLAPKETTVGSGP